jgi:hypothetical protein
MRVAIRLTKAQQLKALPILLRHSTGMMLPGRIFVITPEAALALKDPPDLTKPLAGKRI